MRKILYLLIFLYCNSNYSQEIWYHPKACWHLKKSTTKKTYTTIKYRDFLPQYGYQRQYINGAWSDKIWDEWKLNNNIGYNFRLVGQNWTAIIERNKTAFMAHPEYLAEIDGKRLGYGKSAKFCMSNPNLFQVVLSDAIKWMNIPTNIGKPYSIEPSDGENFCSCKNCNDNGAINAQVYAFANKLSDSIVKYIPTATLNLFAYYKHALPPPFKLRDNIYLVVTPKGFQNDYTPEYLLYVWQKYAKCKMVYEYLGIPQWGNDLPTFYVPDVVYRIGLARKFGYIGFHNETGTNINMTIILTLLNELYKNPKLSWNTAFYNFISQAFPNSGTPMRRMFNRWHTQWYKDKEPLYALTDLQEASNLAKDSNEIARITDLKAYTHYMILYHEWKENTTDTIKTKELFDYVWRISDRMLVNTWAFYNINITTHPNATYQKKYFYPNYTKGYLLDKDIENLYIQDVKKYLAGKKYLAPNTYLLEDILKYIQPNMYLDSQKITIKENTKFYLAAVGKTYVNIENISERKEDTNSHAKLYIYDKDFIEVFNFQLKKGVTYTLNLSKGKLYHCYLTDAFNTSFNFKNKIAIAFDSHFSKDIFTKNTIYSYQDTWKKKADVPEEQRPKGIILKEIGK